MRVEHLLGHLEATGGPSLNRREALRAVGQAGVVGGLATLGLSGVGADAAEARSGPPRRGDEHHTDAMFDVAAVEAGAWAPTRYGAADQRGTFNEVTPAKTASALRVLNRGNPVKTYNLGELMFNGFPAFRTTPERVYDQVLTVFGYEPPAGFGGILQATTPLGPNRVSIHEERFPNSGTYQIATQLDNLNHIGVGATFYNGFQGPDIASRSGTTKLGNEHMGPIVTRGVLLDIVGMKVEEGATAALFTAADGAPVLRDDYRITLEDIFAAMDRGGIRDIGPGDVVLFRTGWTHLVRTDPNRFLAKEPGIYLREARWLAARRPAIIGGDTWGLEVLDPAVTGGNAFPVHQELIVKHGIRIGESMVTDALAEDGVFEFVFGITPQFALGATAGNTPPFALGQPRPGRR